MVSRSCFFSLRPLVVETGFEADAGLAPLGPNQTLTSSPSSDSHTLVGSESDAVLKEVQKGSSIEIDTRVETSCFVGILADCGEWQG